MIAKLKRLYRSHPTLIPYLFFGALTTAVNYLVYYPCLNIWKLPAVISNGIAWAVSVIFAYLTNKLFVFRSCDWSLSVVLPELAGFVGCRGASGALETGILFLAVDLLHRNGNLLKILTGILVVLLNYAAGRWLVFRKKT